MTGALRTGESDTKSGSAFQHSPRPQPTRRKALVAALALLGLTARRTIRTLRELPALPGRARTRAKIRIGALLLASGVLAPVARQLIL